jgi:hypothetical protein
MLERIPIINLTAELLQNFKHLAEQKDCFSCEIAENVPEFITTDSQRLNQIKLTLLMKGARKTHKDTDNLS